MMKTDDLTGKRKDNHTHGFVALTLCMLQLLKCQLIILTVL